MSRPFFVLCYTSLYIGEQGIGLLAGVVVCWAVEEAPVSEAEFLGGAPALSCVEFLLGERAAGADDVAAPLCCFGWLDDGRSQGRRVWCRP